MKQTFKFSTSDNTYNDDTAEIMVDFDEREVLLSDESGNNITTLCVSRNKTELKRLYKSVGNLLEEMEDD